MRKILLLSRYFPPSFSIGGKRAYRLARNLPDLGVRPIVMTAKVSGMIDPTAVALPSDVILERTFLPPSWPEDRNRGSDGTSAASKPRRFKRPTIDIPLGRELLLTPWITRKGVQLIRREKPQLIWATSSPYATLLFGARLAARTGLPWVADLRDPWSLNYQMDHRSRWVSKVERLIERRLFASAALILFTAETAADAYKSAYPELAEKIHVLRNAFDEEDRPERPATRPPGPVRVVHFGNVYGKRSLSAFLKAVRQLIDAGELTLEDIHFENLGRLSDDDLRLSEELGLSSMVHGGPVVPYKEGLARLAQADVQLLVGYGEETLFIPAKLYDYLLTGSRILAQTDSDEVREIVSRTGTGVGVGAADVKETAAALIKLRADALSTTGPVGDATVISEYSAKAGAARLVELLESAGLL